MKEFQIILNILHNEQKNIKTVRNYKKVIEKRVNAQCAVLFNETCIKGKFATKLH